MVLITNIHSTDVEQLKKYLCRVMSETNYLLFSYEEMLKMTEKDTFLTTFIDNDKVKIAKDGEEIIGLAQIKSPSNGRTRHVGELAISVLKEYWGEGISSLLLSEVEEAASNDSIEKIILYVNAENKRALSFYLNNGYKLCGTISKFFKVNGEYFSCKILEKELLDECV